MPEPELLIAGNVAPLILAFRRRAGTDQNRRGEIFAVLASAIALLGQRRTDMQPPEPRSPPATTRRLVVIENKANSVKRTAFTNAVILPARYETALPAARFFFFLRIIGLNTTRPCRFLSAQCL